MKKFLIKVNNLTQVIQVFNAMKNIEEPSEGPRSTVCFYGNGNEDFYPWNKDFFDPKPLTETDSPLYIQVEELSPDQGTVCITDYSVSSPQIFAEDLRESYNIAELDENDNIEEWIRILFK